MEIYLILAVSVANRARGQEGDAPRNGSDRRRTHTTIEPDQEVLPISVDARDANAEEWSLALFRLLLIRSREGGDWIAVDAGFAEVGNRARRG